MSSVFTAKQIGQRFCAAFKSARKFIITDCRTAIFFSAISFGGVKEKSVAMLNFIKAKNQQ